MTARAMNVAVRELFVARGADIENLDVEDQDIARERVIAGDHHVVAVDTDDGVHHLTLVVLRVLSDELHAGVELSAHLGREALDRDRQVELRVVQAVALLRRDVQVQERLADAATFERGL